MTIIKSEVEWKEAATAVYFEGVLGNNSQYDTNVVLTIENKTSTRVETDIAQSVRQ
jgi:hypothetical protein